MPENDPEAQIVRRLLDDVLRPMQAAFVGKDEIINLLGIALVAGENLFLLGPPGTAKTALVNELSRRLQGRSFSYLLTRFTEPSELFGPFDIRRLRDGDLVTNTEGMLPEAAVVFLDELLNANSAILNSLLTVLNERVFRRGKETRKLPLLMVVGASNHLPEEDALAALFDRFLLRVRCDNVGDDRLDAVLRAGWRLDADVAAPAATLSTDDVRALQRRLHTVDLDGVRPAFVELIHKLRRAGIAVSDRRAVKLQRLVAASALLCQRTQVQRSDLWVLRYVWDTEEQQEVLAKLVGDALGDSAAESAAHPRARAADRPDPESLARDLDQLTTELQGAPDAAATSRLRDRLAALAARVQWVAETGPREFLTQKVQGLWPRLPPAS